MLAGSSWHLMQDGVVFFNFNHQGGPRGGAELAVQSWWMGMAGVDRGRWQAEGSLFHGGEPDEKRWDLMDPGPLDSWSVRGWFRPTAESTLQASHGCLKTPGSTRAGGRPAHDRLGLVAAHDDREMTRAYLLIREPSHASRNAF